MFKAQIMPHVLTILASLKDFCLEDSFQGPIRDATDR